MTDASTRKRARAVFFSAIMVTSMVAVGVGGFAGSAAAQNVSTGTSYNTPDISEYDYAVSDSSLPSGVDESDFSDTFSDISSAVDAVDESNTKILVFSGDYEESIQIQGETSLEEIRSYSGPANTTIDGSSQAADGYAIRVQAPIDGLTVEGFKLYGDSTGSSTVNILDQDVSDITLRANTIISENQNAIFVSAELDEFVVEDNILSSETYSGINLGTSPSGQDGYHTDVTIKNNNITGAPTGALSLRDVSGLSVTNNTITDGSVKDFAILMGPANDAVVRDNDVEIEGGDGVVIESDYSPSISTVENITIESNDLDGGFSLDEGDNAPDQYGVVVDNTEVSDLNINKNNISNFKGGIQHYAQGATVSATVDGNTIENTYFGIGHKSDQGVYIANNSISAQVQGISGWKTDDLCVENNTISVDSSTTDNVPDAFTQERSIDISGNNATVRDNTLISTDTALLVQDAGKDLNIVRNNLLADESDIDAEEYGSTLNATYNWWGSESGPADDAVVGDVTVDPWLNASTDEGGEPRIAATVGGDNFSSIQSAIDAAEDGDTVTIQAGQYDENIEISTPNVSVVGQGQGATNIDGRIDIPVDEVTIEALTVQNGAPSGSSEVEGIFVGNANGFSDLDGKVEINDVTVEDVHSHDTEKTLEGIHVKYYDSGDPIDGIDLENVTVQNVTQTAAGADGVKLQAEVNDVSVTQSTFDNIEGSWAYGIVSTPSSNEVGVPADVSVTQTTISNISTPAGNGIGIGIDGKEANGFANANEVDITQTAFLNNNIDIVNKEPDSGSMSAQLNYFGGDAPTVGGNVAYDPVLTTPIDNVEGEPVEDITEYGSVLELSNEGGDETLAVGFSAPPEQNASELFGDIGIDEGTAYTYENDGEGYREIAGDFTPTAGDVIVITTGDPVDEDVVVPINTSVEGAAANPESVEVENGWNLVATGAADDVDEIGVGLNGGTIQDGTQLQDQPRQPGLAGTPPRYGAFEATWIFANGNGKILTGYAENQGANLYNGDVLYPDDQLAEIDGAQIPDQTDDEDDS